MGPMVDPPLAVVVIITILLGWHFHLERQKLPYKFFGDDDFIMLMKIHLLFQKIYVSDIFFVLFCLTSLIYHFPMDDIQTHTHTRTYINSLIHVAVIDKWSWCSKRSVNGISHWIHAHINILMKNKLTIRWLLISVSIFGYWNINFINFRSLYTGDIQIETDESVVW